MARSRGERGKRTARIVEAACATCLMKTISRSCVAECLLLTHTIASATLFLYISVFPLSFIHHCALYSFIMSSATSSDSENNQRHPPPPPPPPLIKPKKKKKSMPPQESINKIWSRFSAQKFSKATVILPFATTSTNAPNSANPVPVLEPKQQNLLVSEDFERAAEECRTRVKKLIKECRRVNMRYRDPDFDIDWDLKWERGYCLNGLRESKFALSGRALTNPTSIIPKAVKRIHEIFEKPTFLNEKVSPADVKQGSLGDCWLMASLTTLANMDSGIERICVEYDTSLSLSQT
jgi:hypothetical protein